MTNSGRTAGRRVAERRAQARRGSKAQTAVGGVIAALLALAAAAPATAQSFEAVEPQEGAPALREVEQDIKREAEAAAGRIATPSGAALVSITGIDDLLAPLEDGVRQQLLDSRVAFSAERIDHIAAAYDGAALNAGVARHLDDALSEDVRRAVALFYNSPLGERMMGLESEGTAALQERNTRHTAAILSMSTVLDADPDRAAVLAAMVEAVNGHQVNRLMLRATTRAMLQGLALSQGRAPTEAELETEVDRELDQVWDLIEEFDRLTVAWIYRDADLSDLKDYRTFLESEESRVFYAAAHAAIIERIEAASFELGQRLGAASEGQPI